MDLGEKGPTPFLTRRMAGSELRACMEGAAHRAGIAEDPIALQDPGQFPGHNIRHCIPDPGQAPSLAPGVPERAGRGSGAGTAVWLSEILDR